MARPRAAAGHRLRHPAGRAVPPPQGHRQRGHRAAACSAGTRRRPANRALELLELVGLPAELRPSATRRSSPAASSNGSAWPGRSPPIRPCCSWTSRSAPSTRSCGPSSSRSSCASSASSTRRSCSSPTTSTRRSSSAIASRCSPRAPTSSSWPPPSELLARPANDFVADFLGDDRGLKLLSLMPATAASRGSGRHP